MESRPDRASLLSVTTTPTLTPVGGFVVMDGREYYRISSFHRMAPFLMSLATNTDLWMFVTSRGGLTAGRVDADGSLFPYLTVDQLHDAHLHTGPVTLVRIDRDGAAPILWKPFAKAADADPVIERNLYKSVTGNRLVFEEINHDLDLSFRYGWSGCNAFGWVRTATLHNKGEAPLRATLLDGLRNVLPYGAPLSLYQTSSNLVDAYKTSEIDPETGLGLFSLSAGITDRAEALEVLKANTVWCCGLDGCRVHLSLDTLPAFRNGRVVPQGQVQNGVRGNYLVTRSLDVDSAESIRWHLVADVGRDHVRISELRHLMLENTDLDARIEAELERANERLLRNVCSADGIQVSGRPESSSHHFANVLFNNMRGGVFALNYDLPITDFVDFLNVRNHVVARRHRTRLAASSDPVTVSDLLEMARNSGDAGFERLCYEYLPLHYGRRHGDPSRPWNHFSIRVRNRTGEQVLNYQGNWRDIFQNWEALCAAYPGFLPSVIAKFVNASTVDGFNPYRITREGVDWETVEANDPWSNIGYWGDHQVVYLLKLLESLIRHEPDRLEGLLGREIFSYAEVPYVIKPYEDILKDPGATIDFDTAREEHIDKRVADLGSDGKLLTDRDGSVYHVNLLEKLLVTALSKLSNMIPDAGIWMNTQRPEWNDANNALGGGGVSVVTLCYLRRYLVFFADMLQDLPQESLPVSREVADWLAGIVATLKREHHRIEADRFDSEDRKRLQDALGEAFSAYRATVYAGGFGGKTDVSMRTVIELCRVALDYVEWGIHTNRREDGLYHAYNLLEPTPDGRGVDVAHLSEMLEGQVAVLSSGLLDAEASLGILERLFSSDLYRLDQNSFMLYPERTLPGFLDRNVIPDAKTVEIPLLQTLLTIGDTSLLMRDADGTCRFHGSFRNASDLSAALDELAVREDRAADVVRDRDAVLELFEEVFNHKSYTGRSGVMFSYEGLGCIYWHMVAKLMLAVQEIVVRADREDVPEQVRDDLARMYFRIRSGLGYEKTVAEYGAFPSDPYSHTPRGGGAKQPGMTGQVKEEILTRIGELGVRIDMGVMSFDAALLRPDEFTRQPTEFRYFDVFGRARSLSLSAGCLAFTYCQVPIIYERVAKTPCISIVSADGSSVEKSSTELDSGTSAKIFSRSGLISMIRVGIPDIALCRH